MRTVRYNIFETSSSSNHSFVLSTETLDENLDRTTLVPNEDGIIVLNGGQFGWEWEAYRDALTKANYLAVKVCLYRCNYEYEDRLKEAIMEFTGAKDVEFNITSDWDDPNYSYIDHDSVDNADEVMYDKEDIIKFIFDRNSILYTGNDNEYAPHGFYDAPDTVYTHRLSIPDLEMNFDFSSKPTESELEETIDKEFDRLVIIPDSLGKLKTCKLYGDEDHASPIRYQFKTNRSIEYMVRSERLSKSVPSIDKDNNLIYFYEADQFHNIDFGKPLSLSYEIKDISSD